MNSKSCRELETLLRDLARQPQAMEPAATLAMEARLRAAFREHWSAAANPVRPAFETASRKLPLWAAGAAATIVLSLGIMLLQQGPSGAVAEPSAGATQSVADSHPTESAAVPVMRRPEAAGENPSATSAPRRIDWRAVDASQAAEGPVAVSVPAIPPTPLRPASQFRSGFVPLFNGGDPQLLEAGQVWRVEMPRGALQSVGMPVVEESRTGRIQVDILLGEDGIARAIRLVQ